MNLSHEPSTFPSFHRFDEEKFPFRKIKEKIVRLNINFMHQKSKWVTLRLKIFQMELSSKLGPLITYLECRLHILSPTKFFFIKKKKKNHNQSYLCVKTSSKLKRVKIKINHIWIHPLTLISNKILPLSTVSTFDLWSQIRQNMIDKLQACSANIHRTSHDSSSTLQSFHFSSAVKMNSRRVPRNSKVAVRRYGRY